MSGFFLETLGLSKALSRKSTVIAMYLLDFVLPQVAKLSKCLQTEKLDLTAISGLVDSTLLTLDDALLPAANWMLELLDSRDELQATTKIKINSESITSFQENVATPFVTDLKGNISRRFSSQDIVAPLVSLILRSCHKTTLLICRHMGKNSLVFLRTTMARNLQLKRNLSCLL